MFNPEYGWTDSTDTPAFVTGSRKYGTVRVGSDVDLVVLVSEKDAEILSHMDEYQWNDEFRSANEHSWSLRFGRLNLIVTTSKERYESWKEGTEILESRSPVTRSEAVSLFKSLFAKESCNVH